MGSERPIWTCLSEAECQELVDLLNGAPSSLKVASRRKLAKRLYLTMRNKRNEARQGAEEDSE